MRMTPFILLALLAGCAPQQNPTEYRWREEWKDPEPPAEEPAAEEAHPAIVALGWTNVTAGYTALPEGLDIYKSPETIEEVKVIAYMAVADLTKLDWDVKAINDPSISGTTDPLKTPAQYYEETAAPVVLNGGYFFSDSGKNYNASVAVSGGTTYGVNINYSSMDWVTMYYPTRGVFYQNASGQPAVGWTYWTGGAAHYLYSQPAENAWDAEPLQVPDAAFPVKAETFAPQTAIGGGPVLLKDGKVVNSWKAELLYGDGADDKMPLARHPRTAVGLLPDGCLVLFVCEGRGMTEGVAGMTFEEEALVLKSLGCTQALNLDGGGSSCLLVNGQETIKVSDGKQRPVASVITLKKK